MKYYIRDWVYGTVENTFYVRYIKRVFDIIFSFIVLILVFPINVLLAVCTFLDVGRPIIFRQQRTGLHGSIFEIIKFRNMTNETDASGQLLPPGERVTSFGRFVRKTSLDELLNFWCILKGNMSIIGPRPLLPEYIDRYNERQKRRLDIKPGLECPSLKKRDHPRTWEEQFEDDVWYVENVSFQTDCKLMVELIKMAFDKNDTDRRSGAVRDEFLGTENKGR